MCLKAVGVEVAHMQGCKPLLHLRLHYDGQLVYRDTLQRAYLPTPRTLLPEQRALLACDKRRRGERRPRRLVLGRCQRYPYHFYMCRLPRPGLPLPHGCLQGHLALELWVDCRQPLYSHPPIFHLRGSNPVLHPFGPRTLWVAHTDWSPASLWAPLPPVVEESPCGCVLTARLQF
ncbi:MAG: hypothetical protein IPN85_05100 [Flavobacteriales bacterium]|nr:hypothetical protein [Flavobacteriales bacterium]